MFKVYHSIYIHAGNIANHIRKKSSILFGPDLNMKGVFLTLEGGEGCGKSTHEIVTRGTVLEGSKFNIEREEVRVRCKTCGYEGPADSLESDYLDHSIPVIACPKCGGGVDITAGQACRVRDLDIVGVDKCSN